MADETDPVETPAEVVETPADPSSSESAPPPETPPPESPVEPAAETPPVDETKARPNWELEQQKLDQERANWRKEQDAREAALLAKIAEASKAATPIPPAEPTPEEKLAALSDEIDAYKDPANPKYDLDAGEKAESKFRKDTIALQRANADYRRQMEESKAAQAKIGAYWTEFAKSNPAIPLADAQAKAAEFYDEAAKAGAKDEDAARPMATYLFNQWLAQQKKAPKSQPSAAPRAAPPPGASTPTGTRVITKETSGARQQPVQQKDADALLLATLRGIRGGQSI